MKHLLFAASLLLALPSAAQEQFSALEQQQVSLATKGLFDKSEAFSVDFAALSPGGYSFPLPVGKARLAGDYYVEIATRRGDAVKAMFDGVVRLSRRHLTHGNVVVVRHSNGLETVYAHNAQNMVQVGQRVRAGQTVAIVGGEGGRTYCLFSIMVNGCRINPETVLSLASHRLFRQVLLCKRTGVATVDVSVVHKEKGAANPAYVSLRNFSASTDPFGKSGTITLNLADYPSDEWAYPLPGAKVISPFGRRGRRSHSGVDIKTRANDNIYAAFAGVVTMSQSYAGYGKCIRIKHPNGLETLYSHNSKNLVKVGDKVKAGQCIALTGRTGRATTEHLHFECRVAGRTVDPAKIFDHRTHSLRQHKVVLSKRGTLTVKR